MLDPVFWVNCRQELAILSANESLGRLNIEIGNTLQAQALQRVSQCYLLIKSATDNAKNRQQMAKSRQAQTWRLFDILKA
ncbi:hypothetical protein [Collimonas fungivorans]|uniref:hypothetical protein n=1 Tax=Collimonas fungivorans TaxID=158899 RepID=UPI0026EEACD8|nr:hypothetical protein [Collimonas fungivorans]